jgi:hypothetical protein
VSARFGLSTTRCQHKFGVRANWSQHELVSARVGVSTTRCQHELVSARQRQHHPVSARLGVRTNWRQPERVSARLGVSTTRFQRAGTTWCEHALQLTWRIQGLPDWRDEPQSLLTAAHARLVYNFVCPQCPTTFVAIVRCRLGTMSSIGT